MSLAEAGKLDKQAADQGITTIELCKQAVADHGTIFKAAIALGVYPNAIRHHLSPKKAKASNVAQR